jgi:hypothetical protein
VAWLLTQPDDLSGHLPRRERRGVGVIAPVEIGLVHVAKAQVRRELFATSLACGRTIAPEEVIRPRIIGVGPDVRSPVEPRSVTSAIALIQDRLSVGIVVLNIGVLIDLGDDEAL